MGCGKKRCSSMEVGLSVVCAALLVVCVGLIIAIALILQPKEAPEAVISGRMVIKEGAVFTEELKNSSSLQFKSLAFDVQRLVSEVYSNSSLDDAFKACQVLEFSKGSVVVNFNLWFHQPVDVKEAEEQLVSGLRKPGNGPLVVDVNSILISEQEEMTTVEPTVTVATTTTSTSAPTVTCAPHQTACGDGSSCIPTAQFCDGVEDCPNGSDEEASLCATTCDGQFLLLGPTGSFHSSNFPLPYNSSSLCRWIIRVEKGLSVKMNFHVFQTEEDTDTLRLYEGVGSSKHLVTVLSGPSSPGTVWLMADQSTVEFSSDDFNNLPGFNATFSAANTTNLSNEEKVNCSFEQGMCFWRQDPEDDGDWIRTYGPTFPPFTGPSFDHTLGNISGYYVVTQQSPGQSERSFRIHSLPLTPPTQPMCLMFWYHMFGNDVHRLQVLVVGRTVLEAQVKPVVTVVFQKDGNYGDNWNYGQVTLNYTTEITVVFEALKKGGMRNDIALDDLSLTGGPCGEGPPEPTPVPIPTTPPPMPPDCGGPFDLWEPNSTFTTPNYPHSYGNKANCLWILHAREGWNIQLHFLDFDVEATYDMVEVRDGTSDSNSELLGVFTGSERPFPDLISTTNQVTVRFYSDISGYGRGFSANFTSGFNLGSPEPCAAGQYQCHTGDCIHGNAQCDGVVDCPDASDEADCVHMLSVNGTTRLRVQQQSSLYTVCAQAWNASLSPFMCTYLGYRAGRANVVSAVAEDSPFATIKVSANGTMELNVSETCVGEQVVSLRCDNQPCGVRLVSNLSMEPGDSGSSRDGTTENREKESEVDSRIVNGTDAQKGAWPWMASLYWSRGNNRHVCGASLIDNEWLVTAAHCVFGKNVHLKYWSIVLGLHSHSGSDSPEVQRRQVDQIIMHKHYNRRTKEADIAMMHLQTPVNFTNYIQPICLPQDDQLFEAGRKCVITGWGKDAEQGSTANVLQEAEVPLVSQALCQEQLPEYNITASMVCAGYAEGGVDSCQGDSGGPLMCEEKGHWLLTGITSFGVGCGRPQRPGVYALVSQFTDWIAHIRRSSSSSSS